MDTKQLQHSPLVVLGGGPGGYPAAFMAAAARPAVGALAEAVGDIRLALGWTVVFAIAALPFAMQLEKEDA